MTKHWFEGYRQAYRAWWASYVERLDGEDHSACAALLKTVRDHPERFGEALIAMAGSGDENPL